MKKISNAEVMNVTNKILDIVEDKNSVVSNNLKKAFYFKGRKSNTLAKEIIEGFSSQGDKILEPFFGGGSFVIASMEANRYVEGIELDPYTFDVFSTLITKIDKSKLQSFYKKVENEAKEKVMNLYKTKCCGQDNFIRKILFDPENDEYFNPITNREIVDGKNVKLMYKCSVCGEKSKRFDEEDYEILQRTHELDNSEFPTDKYIENSRINITASTGVDSYDRNFSERNKKALLHIQNEISKLPACKEKDFIQHALVTSLALAKISMYGSSTDILYHVIREQGQDMNVWALFEEKYKSMLKFQDEFMDYLVEDISNNDRVQLKNASYKILENSNTQFDMIYTDFPYTDQVPYLERNQLFRIWLEKFSDYPEKYQLTSDILDEEIVLTDAPSRKNHNSVDRYYNDLDEMLGILYSVLKDEKYMFFTMKLAKNKYIQTYSEILNLARKNGFEYVTRVNTEKKDPTLRKQSAFANTIMNEVIVVFKKLSQEQRYWFEGNTNYEYVANKLVYEDINRQERRFISISSAVNLIKNDLLSKSIEPTLERMNLAEKIIRENFLVDPRGGVSINGNQLYLAIEDNSTLFVKLYDLIPLFIRKLLEEKGKFVLDDLYLEITASLVGTDSNILEQIVRDSDYQKQISMLLDNYCEVKNGYYVKKKIDNVEYKDSQDVSQFDGYEFENLIKELLEEEQYFDVVTVGGAGDRGVDIIASKLVDKNIERHIFQCKRWISNVGSEPIQRLYAERSYHSYNKAICVTSSDFTSEGKNALERFNVDGWNGWKVQELLNKYFPGKYYNRALDIK